MFPRGSAEAEGEQAGSSPLPGTDASLVAAPLWLICGLDLSFHKVTLYLDANRRNTNVAVAAG